MSVKILKLYIYIFFSIHYESSELQKSENINLSDKVKTLLNNLKLAKENAIKYLNQIFENTDLLEIKEYNRIIGIPFHKTFSNFYIFIEKDNFVFNKLKTRADPEDIKIQLNFLIKNCFLININDNDMGMFLDNDIISIIKHMEKDDIILFNKNCLYKKLTINNLSKNAQENFRNFSNNFFMSNDYKEIISEYESFKYSIGYFDSTIFDNKRDEDILSIKENRQKYLILIEPIEKEESLTTEDQENKSITKFLIFIGVAIIIALAIGIILIYFVKKQKKKSKIIDNKEDNKNPRKKMKIPLKIANQ